MQVLVISEGLKILQYTDVIGYMYFGLAGTAKQL